MAQKLPSAIIVRNDTTNNWQSNNPILLKGEIAVEQTTENKDLIKIGDGVTAWNELPYIYGNSISGSGNATIGVEDGLIYVEI